MENQNVSEGTETIAPRRTKLDSAYERLPKLNERTTPLFEDLMSTFGGSNDAVVLNDLDVLAQHLAFEVRRLRTVAAEAIKGSNPLKIGDTVLVVTGPQDLVGRTGTVDEVKRVRCYVTVGDRKHYLFNSDVRVVQEPVSSDEEQAPETVVSEAASA